jgi:hypothetical protein
MNKHRVTVIAGMMIVALAGIAIAQISMRGLGMAGGQMSMGQSPQSGEDRPSAPPHQMPMTPEFGARMMNACIGAMEGMAQMGRMMGGMMGGQGGTSQTPSEHKQ